MSRNSTERPRIALLVVTSERSLYLELLVASLRMHGVARQVDHILVIDTSLTPRRRRGEKTLQRPAKSYEKLDCPGLSFHKVLRLAWAHLAIDVGATHVVMFEEDFVLLRKLPMERLVQLANLAGVTQVVLPRQRWFGPEFSYGDRETYLRSRHSYEASMDGDRLQGYFTSNPHVMRLDRILPLVGDVTPSDDYTWESEYAAASGRRGFVSLQASPSRPWVWHIGASTSEGLRVALEEGRSPGLVYLRAHAKRTLVVIRRHVEALARGAGDDGTR